MARQIVNIGSSANQGDGDPLRVAFDKINDNFDELYARDINTDSQTTVYAVDSTLLVDGETGSIVLDGTVKGNIVPDTDVAYDLGSATKRFRDLYLSGSTIDLGGTTLSVVGGELQLGGVKVITQSELDVAVQNNITTDLKGSVFGDDSTLLVDGVNGTLAGPWNNPTQTFSIDADILDINLGQYAVFDKQILIQNSNDLIILGGDGGASFQMPGKSFSVQGGNAEDGTHNVVYAGGSISMLSSGDHNYLSGGQTIIGAATGITLTTAGPVTFNNDYFEDGFRGGFTTNKSILQIMGAEYLDGGDNGGGVIIAGGSARNGGNNGDVIIASGVGGADGTGFISLLSNYISTSGTWLGTQTMDIKGSVFGDDSTLLVDGVNGSIPYSVLSGAPSFGNWTFSSNTLSENSTGNAVIQSSTFAGSKLILQTRGPTDKQWIFDQDGGLTFPDDTVQSTAYTGPQTSLDGDVTGSVFADDSTLLVDGVNGSIPYSVISDVQVTESDLLVDFANIVATQIQTNGLPINTTATGTLTVDGTLTVEESYSSTPTTKFFEIETGAGNNRILRTGVNMSAFAQNIGPEIGLTSYRSSPANGDAGPELVLRASTGASVNDVIATIGTQVTDTTDGDVTSKISFTVQNNGAEITPLSISGSTVDMQTADQVSIGNENGAVDIYGEVEFNSGTTTFTAGNSVDFLCDVDFSGATVTGLPTANNAGVAYQFGYSAHDAESTVDNDFTVDSVAMIVSLTATANAQGARIDISGITTNSSAGTGLIYVQRRVNSGSWNVWNAFVVDGGGDHISHSFVDFYDTAVAASDVSAGDTVEYKLTNGTSNTAYNGNSSGDVDFELFFGFQFTATEIPVSYSLTQP